MAASESKGTSVRANGCILAEANYNRLELLHEQISGLAELLFVRLQDEIESDAAAMTAYQVLLEKVREAAAVARAGFGALNASRIETVIKESPDRFADASSMDVKAH
jgi:hypothetical protein